MKVLSFLSCFLVAGNFLSAQALRVSGSQLLEKSAVPAARHHTHALQSVRLESGKLWVNGNLIPGNELPPALGRNSTHLDFYATFQGIRSVELQVDGKNYLIQPGRISDISRLSVGHAPSASSRHPDQQYLEKLQEESPETFRSLAAEADLNKKSLQLSREFITTADPRRKAELRTELRRVLDQLFDLNVQNQQEELDFLEEQIQIRREELKIKQGNKARLVAKNLSELTEIK